MRASQNLLARLRAATERGIADADAGRVKRPESSLLHDLMLPLAALPFPNIDPVIVHIGPVAIRWYGVGYIVGILFAWWYANRLIANGRLWPGGQSPLTPEDIDDLLLWAAIGVVLGGRIGY